MKSVVLYTGFALLIINLIAFAILSRFSLYPFIASEISIASSLLLVIWLVKTKIDDAFGVFLFFGLGVSLIVKYVTSHFMAGHILDSHTLLLLAGILICEFGSVILLKQMSRNG